MKGAEKEGFKSKGRVGKRMEQIYLLSISGFGTELRV